MENSVNDLPDEPSAPIGAEAAPIYGTEAPKYFDRGLVVVPLEPNAKRPAKELGNWAAYAHNPPGEVKRHMWAAKYAANGIGVLSGTEVMPGYKLAAIDNDDARFARVSEAIVGVSPCVKVGKKGPTQFVRVRADEKLRSTTLYTAGKEQCIDILFNGKMTVLPPSVHPDTGRPYVWEGTPLHEVNFASLPEFRSAHLLILKEVVAAPESLVLIEGKGTHDAALRLSSKLVRLGAGDDMIDRIFRALVPPDYDGDTLDQLAEMISSARAKGFDDLDEDEGETNSERAVKLIRRSGIELFKCDDRAFASEQKECGGFRTYAIESGGFGQLLRKRYFDAYRKPLSRQAIGDAIATLEAIGLFTGVERKVYLRVAGLGDSVVVDLGRDDCRVATITPAGWSIGSSDVRFVRPSGFQELPEPERGGSLHLFREIFNLAEAPFKCAVAFMMNALRGKGPFFGGLTQGPQGSGKSNLCWAIKMLIDPSVASKQRLPDKEWDLMIHAQDHFLINYDNASGMKGVISDSLCTLATGGGLTVRKLYVTAEGHVFSFSRPVMINGISNAAKQPDLLERMIPINLEGLGDNVRRTESEMEAEFFAARPKILGAFYDAVSSALARLPTTPTPIGIRMADAAKWIAAGEEALGFATGELVHAVRVGQDDMFRDRITEDPLMIALQRVARSKPFEGYVSELYLKLDDESGRRDLNLPKTPSHLSNALTRLKPAMGKAGLLVEDLGRDNRGRRVRITASEAFTKVWG